MTKRPNRNIAGAGPGDWNLIGSFVNMPPTDRFWAAVVLAALVLVCGTAVALANKGTGAEGTAAAAKFVAALGTALSGILLAILSQA